MSRCPSIFVFGIIVVASVVVGCNSVAVGCGVAGFIAASRGVQDHP